MASFFTGNKFNPNNDIPDLSGKVFAVTGGTAGIGFGIVAHLLQHKPAKIYLLSNKEEHADEAVEELKKWGDVDNVCQWVKCNLLNLKQTDQVAKELAELPKLDGLFCNAGIGVGKYSLSEDGIDSHFQINHLSQFHLALTVLPLLLKSPNSRLVFQSSDLHRAAPSSVAFTSLSEINDDIGATNLYARTKLAQILFTKALVRRLEEGKLPGQQSLQTQGAEVPAIWINASHPGAVNTDQPEQSVEAYGKIIKPAVGLIRNFMKEPVEEGCRPALFAGTSPDVVKEGIQGSYIVPDRKATAPSNQALDVGLGENLWGLSVRILKEKVGPLSYQK